VEKEPDASAGPQEAEAPEAVPEQSASAEESKAEAEEARPAKNPYVDEIAERKRRLFNLRMKINKGRKANKEEVKSEWNRLNDPNLGKKEKAAERHERSQKWREEMESRGLEVKDSELFEQQDFVDRRKAAAEEKEARKATFGWEVFNQDTQYRAYDKRLAALPKASSAQEGDVDPMSYGGQGFKPSEHAVERMRAELQKRREINSKFSRRRKDVDAEDVTYINDNNKSFNKRIKKAYDRYTVEIRQNLERGTAL